MSRSPVSRTAVTTALGIGGWVVSYAFFLKWMAEHDWAFVSGWVEAFTSSDFATGLILDLVAVTFMCVAVAWWERDRIGRRWAVAMVASLSLSVSVSLAIYLVRLWQVRPAPADGPHPQGAASSVTSST